MKFHDFSWKGVLASSKGIVVERQAQYIRPAQRQDKVSIPGRSGSLHLVQGNWPVYETVLYSPGCWLAPAVDAQSVADYLSGEGLVIFGSMQERAYQARLVNQIPFTRLDETAGYAGFSPIFECEPLAYQSVPAADLTITNSGSVISNPGTAHAFPVIRVYGNGDILLTVTGQTVHLMGITSGILLDWTMGDALALDGSTMLNNRVSGDAQALYPGNNPISWTGDVSKVEITPNWRYV
jgi:phage-related protein